MIILTAITFFLLGGFFGFLATALIFAGKDEK